MTRAENIVVGDKLKSINIPSITEMFADKSKPLDISTLDLLPQDVRDAEEAFTTVTEVKIHQKNDILIINGEYLTASHALVIARGEDVKFVTASEIVEGDAIWSHKENTFVHVESISSQEGLFYVYSLILDPHPFYFTDKTLSFDNTTEISE